MANTQVISRHKVVTLRYSLTSADGVENDLATLDGNNPLAGQTLIFEIEVQGLRAATPEEIRQRRVLD